MTESTPKKPRRRKPKGPFSDELIDQLLAHVKGKDAESLLGESGLVGQLKKQLAERMLAAELTHHLNTEASESAAVANHRNGSSPKTVATPDGPLALDIPRDRLSTFDPVLVAKHQRRLPGFDDHVIGMYARGMTMREIQAHLLELYGLGVSAELISTITDEVMTEVTQWQSRPLETMYPIVYFDALRLKIRDDGMVRNKAVYLALGIDAHGNKDVLGMWIEQTEGAKFWLKVFNELRNRGVHDVLIAVVDGLRGFPEAIEAVFPKAQIQTCIVHLIRNSLNHVSWKDRKALAADLRPLYQAPDAAAAEAALQAFETGRWARWPGIAQAWRRQWPQITPFFAYPPEVRHIIYTTNAIESLHMQVRKIVKSRGHFPSDEAARKLIFLTLRNIAKRWTMPHRYWRPAANQFAIMFGDRFTNPDADL
ncbi:MAG: IS256 family transposase [Burkholderiales bacterium]|nr:IS256 family transposase [Burkholderiales bacterium]MBZ0250293.1 IS256 family transposase [Burkholderiales bacterium]